MHTHVKKCMQPLLCQFAAKRLQRTRTNRGESPPEGGVTTETVDLWCKDTQLFNTCQ